MVCVDSNKVSRASLYSGFPLGFPRFRIQGFHLFSLTFPGNSTSSFFPHCGPTTPTQCRFGLFPFRSPLLRESISLSSPPATKMFQFAGFSSHFSAKVDDATLLAPGFPIRISLLLRLRPSPQSFSQVVTSFFCC